MHPSSWKKAVQKNNTVVLFSEGDSMNYSKIMIFLCSFFYVGSLFSQIIPPEYQKMIDDALKNQQTSQEVVQKWDMRIEKISGSVYVKSSENDDWVKVDRPLPLEFNDQIKTDSDGSAEIALDDKGVIFLGRNSEIEINSISQSDSMFSLKIGSLVAKIQHFLSSNKFQIKTPVAVCVIRGTEFAIEHSKLGDETRIAVYDEGKLAVNMTGENTIALGEVILEKDNEVILNPLQKRIRPSRISRMQKYRSNIKLLRQRLIAIRKAWKPVNISKRTKLREEFFKKHISQKTLNQEEVKKKVKKKSRIKNKARNRSHYGRMNNTH